MAPPWTLSEWLGLFPINDIDYQATIRGPGLVFILPFLEKAEIIDIRTKVFEVPSQQILTTDSVTLTVDAVVYYRVFDPVKAATGAMDYNEVHHSYIDSHSKNYREKQNPGCSWISFVYTWWYSGDLPTRKSPVRTVQ